MSYHIFNNLSELLNRDLAAKTRRGILFKDLMDRECNCNIPYKVIVKCVYEGTFRSKCLIYEVKFSMCNVIYMGNTQQTIKKIMNVHFSDLLRLIENGINKTRLLPNLNRTLILLCHVQIYVSI